MTWRLLSQSLIYQGWGRYLLLDIAGPDGQVIQRQMDDHGSGGAVLPYDAARRTSLLVRLPRAGPLFVGDEPFLLEAAAGLIEPGESPEAGVRREAMEELGLSLGPMELVAQPWTSPGVCTERLSLFLAPYAAIDRIGAGGGVAGEDEAIEVVEIGLADLWTRMERGEVEDLKTLLLVYALRQRRPELFAAGA